MSMSKSEENPDVGTFPVDRVKPLAALLAAIRLFRNPQDTSQVALLEIKLGGYSRAALFDRFIKSENGSAVIRERRSLIELLDNHDYLRSLPDNALGRHYLAHMEREGLSVRGLFDAMPAVTQHIAEKPEAVRIFLNYAVRCTHDLYHVLVGYGRDELGEICVVATAYQHLKIRGYALMFTLGPFPVLKQLRRLKINPSGVFAAVREAKRIGCQADWLPAQEIESILAEDLDDLRIRLNVQRPKIYNKIVSRVRANSAWESGPWVLVPTPIPAIAARSAVPN